MRSLITLRSIVNYYRNGVTSSSLVQFWPWRKQLQCFWLQIHEPGCNRNMHSMEHVHLLRFCFIVLKLLNEEAIVTAPIVSLEASDNSCVIRLQLWRRVWWQTEHGCVADVKKGARCDNGKFALQLSIINIRLRPVIRASNPFCHSKKMTCVIQDVELHRLCI